MSGPNYQYTQHDLEIAVNSRTMEIRIAQLEATVKQLTENYNGLLKMQAQETETKIKQEMANKEETHRNMMRENNNKLQELTKEYEKLKTELKEKTALLE